MEWFNPRKFLFVSLGAHGLLIGAALLWTPGTAHPEAAAMPLVFRTAPAAHRIPPSLHALEHHVSLTQRRGGAPPVAHRALTTGLSRGDLPAVPAVASLSFLRPVEFVGGRHPEATGDTGTGREAGRSGNDGSDENFGRELGNLFTTLQVTGKRVGVVFDVYPFLFPVPTDPAALQRRRDLQAERDYLERSFGPHRFAVYDVPGLFVPRWTVRKGELLGTASLGSAILDLVNSSEQLEAIYVLGGFSWANTRNHRGYVGAGNTDLWPIIQQRVRERKIKLYLHVLVPDVADGSLDYLLGFARSTGGTVKIGPLPRPGEEVPTPAP